MKTKHLFFTLLAVVLFTTSCVSKKKWDDLNTKYLQSTVDYIYANSEKMDCEDKNRALTAKIVTLQEQIEQLKEDTAAMGRRIRIVERNLEKTRGDYDELLKTFTAQNFNSNAEIQSLLGTLDERQRELKEKELKLLELQNILAQKDAEVKALRAKVSNALKGFEGKGLVIYEKNGKVYVSLDEKLLFASGSWEIDKTGKEALQELGKVLAGDQDINIVIEGHTDNVPFKGTGNIKDNWDLSVMRATAVVKELLRNKEINPQRISASGRGEYIPVDNEDTREARAKNRRTEIILTPKLDELFKIIDGQ